MKRIFRVQPGYDCGRGPCPSEGCPGFGKARGLGHGQHGEEWFYAAVDDEGLVALALTVYTDIMPSGTPNWRLDEGYPVEKRREGMDLTLHVGFPTEKETMRWWDAADKGRCDLLPGTWCDTSNTSALQARDFFRAHGDPNQAEQSEAFWQALEAALTEKRGRLPERADALWSRCACCGGEGVVPVLVSTEAQVAIPAEKKGMRWEDETRSAAEHLGYTVVETDGVDDYQGWGVYLLRKGDEWAILPWNYGSCSGCDAYEEENMSTPELCVEIFGGLIETFADEVAARIAFSGSKGW